MKKVAIVGVEGSGKTVMLAGLGELYSQPDAQGYFLAPKNFETANYVSDKIERMRKGEWPSATAGDELQGLDWTLKRKAGEGQRPESVCEVSFLDFAGEVYRVAFGVSEKAELADEAESLKSYIRNADDVIVLINLSDIITHGLSDTRVRESMWITNGILEFALDDKNGRKVPRAAIVLSQADSYADTIAACGGVRGVLKKHLPHVANNYDWLDLMAANAVDRTVLGDDGLPTPAPDFKTTGLQPIMDWIVSGMSAQDNAAFQIDVESDDASRQGNRDVYIMDSGNDKIALIKAIRDITGLGLKDAKDLADASSVQPARVVRNIPYEKAVQVVEQLEKSGARVRMSLVGRMPKKEKVQQTRKTVSRVEPPTKSSSNDEPKTSAEKTNAQTTDSHSGHFWTGLGVLLGTLLLFSVFALAFYWAHNAEGFFSCLWRWTVYLIAWIVTAVVFFFWGDDRKAGSGSRHWLMTMGGLEVAAGVVTPICFYGIGTVVSVVVCTIVVLGFLFILGCSKS